MDQIPNRVDAKPGSFSALMGEYRRSGDADVALNIKRRIKDMSRGERASLVRSFDAHRQNEEATVLPVAESRNDASSMQTTEPSSGANQEVVSRGNRLDLPYRMRMRREAHAAKLGTTDAIKHADVSVEPTVETKEAEAKPSAVEPAKVESSSPKGLVDMETFGPTGEPQSVEQSESSDVKIFEAPVGAESPKQGIAQAEAPKNILGNNEEIAKKAFAANNGEEIKPKAQEATIDDGGGQADFQKSVDALPTNNKTVVPPQNGETPQVIIDSVGPAPENQVPHSREEDLAQKPEPDISSTEESKQPESEEGAVPIKVVKTEKSDNNTDQTVYPLGEQREAGVPTASNGVDDEVDRIKNRIFDQQVDGAREENAQTSIAPAPKVPGNQEPESPEATVTVDGEGVIGKIQPAEKNQTVEVASAQPPVASQQTVIGRIGPKEGEDDKKDKYDARSDIDHRKMAGKVTGNEDASFFAKLTGRWKKTKSIA